MSTCFALYKYKLLEVQNLQQGVYLASNETPNFTVEKTKIIAP
jgi:hypothetical protein